MNIKILSAFILGALLFSGVSVFAATILFPTGGGTGWGNIQVDTFLTGNGTGRLATTSVGSGLSLSGGVLSALASGSSLSSTTPWTPGFLTFVVNNGTLSSVATGTISSANSALTVTAGRSAVGGAAVFTISTTTNTMFTGTPGQTLAYTNLGWTGVATTTFSSPLVYSTGNVTCPTCATGTIFGESWQLSINTFAQSGLTPTTTQNIMVNGIGTSTFKGGIEGWQLISAPYFNATSTTATSTFSNGIDVLNGCFSISGTCLQTYIQNATAYKSAANYATAVALPTNTYNNGSSGVGATLTAVSLAALTVDGQSVSAGQRILVKDESDQTHNGVYVVTNPGSGIAAYILTRATDFNISNDVYAGVTVPVLAGGTVNGDTLWTQTTTGTIVIGTSNIAFIESASGGAFGITWAPSVNVFGQNALIPTSTAMNFGITAVGTSTLKGGLEVWRQVGAPYFNATSTTATSTFAGGILSTGLRTTNAPTFDILTSALIITDSAGNTAEYAGTSCTNQFVRSLSVLGVATCATVGAGDVSLANLTATDATLTFSGTYNGSTARTIGLNLGNANTWTALQTFGNATTTRLTVSGAGTTTTMIGNEEKFGILGIGSTATTTLQGNNATSSFAGGVLATRFNSTGTSTLAGVDLSSGCFAILGVCLSTGGSGTVTSIATGDGITGGTITTSGTIRTANQVATTTLIVNGVAYTSTATPTNFANTSTFVFAPQGNLGVGTSTPRWALQIASSTGPQLALSDTSATSAHWTFRNANGDLFLATSTPGNFATTSGASWMTFLQTGSFTQGAVGISTSSPPYKFTLGEGTIFVPEVSPATTTSMTLDFATSTQQRVNIGTSATTIAFKNVRPGAKLTIITCNPHVGTAGAITFTGGSYSGGVQPGNTTAIDQCDIWYWLVSDATTTKRVMLTGMSPGFQ